MESLIEKALLPENRENPSMIRAAAAEARRLAEALDRRADDVERTNEAWALARDLKENFDQDNLEAFVKKEKERLGKGSPSNEPTR
jgi:hypothetical protein